MSDTKVDNPNSEVKTDKNDDIITLITKGYSLDVNTFKIKDVNSKNIATSYFTPEFSVPGSLKGSEFIKDNNGVLISIKFDVITPAKNSDDKSKIDGNSIYIANVLYGKVLYMATKTCPFSQRVRSCIEISGVPYEFKETKWKYVNKKAVKEAWFMDVYKKAVGRDKNVDARSPVVLYNNIYVTDSVPASRFVNNELNKGKSVFGVNSKDLIYIESTSTWIMNTFGRAFWGLLKSDDNSCNDKYNELCKKMQELNDYLSEINDKGYYLDYVTFVDIVLWPFFARMEAASLFINKDNIKLNDDYIKKYKRVYSWLEFVRQQKWAQNVVVKTKDYLDHYKEVF